MIRLPFPPASLRGRVNNSNWVQADLERLAAAYAAASLRGELNLKFLSGELGRSASAICRKARELGLTNPCRAVPRKPKVDRRKYKTAEERMAALSERMKQQHRERGHPMAGKTHTPDAREKISAKSKASWAGSPQARRDDQGTRLLEAKIAKFGSTVANAPSGSWKAGWREVGGKRNYFRSRWEANYARYLEWLKGRGEIVDWFHEPETFWFDGIKRGVRSYKPDFRVYENDGAKPLHEVKGWMDARSHTTLKRMAKYHPHEQIVLIREKEYNSIARTVGRLIEGWESGGRCDRT